MGESKKQRRLRAILWRGLMLSSLWVGKTMHLSTSLEPKGRAIVIMSLWNVLKIKEIALLLVPDTLRLALGKTCNAHPLFVSPCSPPVPQIKCQDLMGMAQLPGGTWCFLCHPQSIVAFCLHFSYGSHTNPCLWGFISSERFLVWWLMSITFSLDRWLTKERVIPIPLVFIFKWVFSGRLEDLLELSSYGRISRKRFFNEGLNFNI